MLLCRLFTLFETKYFKLILNFSLQIFSREDFMEDEQMRTLIKVTNSKLNVYTHWSVAKFEIKYFI